MPRPRAVLLLILVGCTVATSLEAQQVVLGSRLRISTPCPTPARCEPVIGTLIAQQGSTLTLADAAGDTSTVVLSPASSLEIFRGRRGNARTGLGIGAATGVVLGISECNPNSYAPCGITVLALTVVGALDGLIIGALIRTDRWERVVQPTIAIGRVPGALSLGARIRF